MKKIIIAALVILLCSCTQEGLFDESYEGTPERTTLAELYLVKFSTLLVPDYLIALEDALAYDAYGYYSSSSNSRDYISGGVSIRTIGTQWTINSKKVIKGVTIKCIADDTWELDWTGPYSLTGNGYDYYADNDEYAYKTHCKVTAKMLKKTAYTHYDWLVTMNGERTERKGYACTFSSSPDMTFTTSEASKSYSSWDSCEGAATMIVTKNGEKVDMARMDYLGTDTRYFGGL